MSDEPKPKENESPTPADAPTDYPPVGVAVSTGTAWGASIDASTLLNIQVLPNGTNIDTLLSNGVYTFGYIAGTMPAGIGGGDVGYLLINFFRNQTVGYQFLSTRILAPASPLFLRINNFGTWTPWTKMIGADNAGNVVISGTLASPVVTVAGSPVVTVAMLDPVQIEQRLAALEAGGVTPPPADDERAQTRAGLTATAQASQDLADEIFAKQRAEAERVQNIMNPPPQPSQGEEEVAKPQRTSNPKEK